MGSRQRSVLFWALAVCLLALLVFVLRNVGRQPPQVLTPPRALPVQASALLAAYHVNMRQADSVYKGKILRVTGVVAGRKVTAGGVAYLLLQSEQAGEGVQCMGRMGDNFDTLPTGQTVTVEGQCRGFPGYVFLQDCVLR